eukprot:c15729_g1_i1 orf=26-643(-)
MDAAFSSLATGPGAPAGMSKTTLCPVSPTSVNSIASPAATVMVSGVNLKLPTSSPTSTFTAIAGVAKRVAAVVAIRATDETLAAISEKEAEIERDGRTGAARGMAQLTLEVVSAVAFKPQKEGTATVAAVRDAIARSGVIRELLAYTGDVWVRVKMRLPGAALHRRKCPCMYADLMGAFLILIMFGSPFLAYLSPFFTTQNPLPS